MSAGNNKAFLAKLIFGGGQMNDDFMNCITRSIYQCITNMKNLYYSLCLLNTFFNPTHFWWCANQRSIGATQSRSIGYYITARSLQDP